MDKKELLNLIDEYLGIKSQGTMIDRQIDNFKKQHGYSYKEIGRAVYFYFVKMNRPFKRDMGIGIVPYVVNEANSFFEQEKRRQNELERQGKILKKSQEQERDIIKAKPKNERKGIKLIKFEDL